MSTPLTPAPLIYAHRGHRAQARDNTIDAFELAIAAGADGIELDVQHTADSRLVVYHDHEHPEAGAIAGIHFDELRRIDPEIPDFDSVIEAVARRCYLNIEIKNSAGPSFDRGRRVADAVVSTVERHEISDAVWISSFDSISVRRVKEAAPELLTGQLFSSADPRRAIEWAARDGHDSANVPLAWVEDAATIDRIHDLGLKVAVWTVNDPDQVRRLALAGADVLISDDPGVAREGLNPS